MLERKKALAIKLSTFAFALALGGCVAKNPDVNNETLKVDQNTVSGNNETVNTVSDNDIDAIKEQNNNGSVLVNETNFPDPYFRAYLEREYDENDDGYFDQDELNNVTCIECPDIEIESLKGVEFFTELETLECYDNRLSDLDVSKNTKLSKLICYGNAIGKLDISDCPRLNWVRDVLELEKRDKIITYGSNDSDMLQFDNEVELLPKKEFEVDLNSTFTEEQVQKYWKLIYADILQESHATQCGFIYLNDDPIPEIALGSGEIYTIVNGKISKADIWNADFSYVERENVLDNDGGHMGSYYDRIWMIGENGFELLHNGEYYVSKFSEINKPEKTTYLMDGKEVNREKYINVLYENISDKEMVNWDKWGSCSYYEMMEYLRGYGLKDYKKAYSEWLRSEKNEYLREKLSGYTLINRTDASPLLLGIGDQCGRLISFDDGLLNDSYYFYLDTSDECYIS